LQKTYRRERERAKKGEIGERGRVIKRKMVEKVHGMASRPTEILQLQACFVPPSLSLFFLISPLFLLPCVMQQFIRFVASCEQCNALRKKTTNFETVKKILSETC